MRSTIFRDKIITTGIAFLFFCIFSACVKTTNTVPVVNSSSTIAVIIKNATNLTYFDSALKKTGLILTLDSAGPFTIFVPPDAVFTAAGITDSTIYKASLSYLTRLVRYHLIAGDIYTAAILGSTLPGPNAPTEAASINPSTGKVDTLFVTVNATGIYINGNLLTQTDVTGSNGVIHAVSAILIPPTGSIWQTLYNDSTLNNDSTLTYLVAALNRASMGATNMDTLLSGNGVYSLFAPTNNAFRAFGFTSKDTINTIDPDSLARILSFHVVPGRVFSSDFTISGQLPTLIAGDSISFSPTYTTLLMQKGDSTYSNIITTNIMANNGVIHKIDQVLIP